MALSDIQNFNPSGIQYGTGMYMNPANNQMQQLYAKYNMPTDPDAAASQGNFSDYSFDPTGRQSLAGYKPGYYTDQSSTFDNFMERATLGGLAALGGAAAGSAMGAGAGAGGLDAGSSPMLLADAGSTTDVPVAWDAAQGGASVADAVPGVGGDPLASAVNGMSSTGGASTSGFGSVINALGGYQNIIGTAGSLYGLNQLSNNLRNLSQQQANYSSLDQPQRAPYQAKLSQLVNNPQQYLNTDPFAQSLGAMYRNNIIPRQVAQSGNPANVLDQQGSQFVNALAGNYNTQMGNLSGMAGFGFPQSSYAGLNAGSLGAGAAGAGAMGTAMFGNMLGQNLGRMQGQSGTGGIFGGVTV